MHAKQTVNDGERDATPCPGEVDDMAQVLEGQHGRFAADVADFFSAVHGQKGDTTRAWAWQGVATRVRKRAQARGSDNHLSGFVMDRPQ